MRLTLFDAAQVSRSKPHGSGDTRSVMSLHENFFLLREAQSFRQLLSLRLHLLWKRCA